MSTLYGREGGGAPARAPRADRARARRAQATPVDRRDDLIVLGSGDLTGILAEHDLLGAPPLPPLCFLPFPVTEPFPQPDLYPQPQAFGRGLRAATR